MRRLYRVDTSSGTVREEDLSGELGKTGGRGLTSLFVAREVPPRCHPLGAANKLVIAPGLLSGTSCINSGRLSVGGKSPLTGTVKESNVGGTVAHKLGRLRIGGIVLENRPSDGRLCYLRVTQDGVEVLPADDLRGLGNYETVERLRSRHGDRVGVMSIGPAGEMRLGSASVAVTDPEGRPSRHAGRGGMGAVMGAKGIKAVVVDARSAPGVDLKDGDGFKAAARTLRDVMMGCDATKPNEGHYAVYGMNAIMDPTNDHGALPTRNFRRGQFEGAKRINGKALHDTIVRRGGIYNHAGCSNCIVQCSNVFVDEDGTHVTSALEYETLYSMGANCEIDDLDALARIDRLCDDYGLDTIETGCAIAVAMEAGVRPFGDPNGSIELLHEIGGGTPLGRILGSGAAVTGQVFGVERVPVVKGQAIPGYDPRVIKGLGVTYATSPMGADHTAGFAALFAEEDMDPEGKAELSLEMQISVAFLDAAGLCITVADAATPGSGGPEAIAAMVNAAYGWGLTVEGVAAHGRKILAAERGFNEAAGFGRERDRLPEYLTAEPLAPNNTVFDVPAGDLDRVVRF